jgi:branched-chain amino acid transport system ATP-binding protein
MLNGTLLRVAGLHVQYGQIRVLHGVSLTVERGEIVAIIGATARARRR